VTGALNAFSSVGRCPAPSQSSDAFEAWKGLAAGKLFATVCNQLSITANDDPDHFSGPPKLYWKF
jgi:hypothetical protein